ncbi:hypothetical protein [Phenylobacterium sp.]|uniref:hypothetical protein n=1 Tax=Phenylobacterium sp. TaxID=1871053 RepID=UPI0025E1C562|nr:hypothetical protein [Phenylobacterium sp.]
MTAGLAADGERAGFGPGERIPTMTILRGAVARLRRGGWRAAALGLAIFGASAASDPLQKQLGITDVMGPAYWAFLAGTMAVGALLGGLTTRLLVAGPAGWLRLDRGLAEYVAIMLAMAMTLAGIGVAYGAFAVRQFNRNGQADPQAALWLALAAMALYAAAFYGWFRLSLWPVARLMGRRLDPRRAWLLMLRATRGMALGYLLAALPLVLLYAGAFASGGEAAVEAVPNWAGEFTVAVWGVASYAMVATIYQLRVEAPATVASVFE